MPQQESNIKMSPSPEPTTQFFGFHLEQSLQIEVFTATPSRRRTMHHGTVVTGNGQRLSKDFCPKTCKTRRPPTSSIHSSAEENICLQ
jgi:hypothetical protein